MSGTHSIKKSRKHSQRHAGTKKHVAKPKHHPRNANVEPIREAKVNTIQVNRVTVKDLNAEGHRVIVVKTHPNRRRPTTFNHAGQNPA